MAPNIVSNVPNVVVEQREPPLKPQFNEFKYTVDFGDNT
jgi:hypothetical protein